MAKKIDDRLIGRYITAICKQHGLSQENLSTRLGIDTTKLQKYENGIEPIPASTLWHLARILNEPITSFYDEKAANNTLHALFRIRDDNLRENLFELIKSIEVYY